MGTIETEGEKVKVVVNKSSVVSRFFFHFYLVSQLISGDEHIFCNSNFAATLARADPYFGAFFVRDDKVLRKK